MTACDEKTGGVVSVIPIVGKTSLAQLDYNDEKVIHYFFK